MLLHTLESIVLQLTRYINYLLTYLLTVIGVMIN